MFRMGSLCTVACVTFLQEEFKVTGIAKTQKHRNTEMHKDPKRRKARMRDTEPTKHMYRDKHTHTSTERHREKDTNTAARREFN